MTSLLAFAALVAFTLLAALADAEGFVHASYAWDAGIVWREFAWSVAAFMAGAVAYLLAQPFLRRFGILSPELQTGVWFGATAVLVALLSGKFVTWRASQQVVAIVVVVGIAWLVTTTSTS